MAGMTPLDYSELTHVEELTDETLNRQRLKGREKYGKGLISTDVPNLHEVTQELADALQYSVAAKVKQEQTISNIRSYTAQIRACVHGSDITMIEKLTRCIENELDKLENGDRGKTDDFNRNSNCAKN